MSQEINKAAVFAKVVGNEVVEYPVTGETITMRGDGFKSYYPVIVSEPDSISQPGYIYTSRFVVENLLVRLVCEATPMTLEQCIEKFRLSHDGENWVPHEYGDIPKGELEYFQKKLGEFFEDKLEAMVKERYTSLDTLLGRYSKSTVLAWKHEAAFVQSKLDALWNTIIAYFDDLAKSKRSLPTKMEDVVGLVPDTSWADMQ